MAAPLNASEEHRANLQARPPPEQGILPANRIFAARALWLLYAAACLTLFVLGTLETAREPLPACTGAQAACPANTQLSIEDLEIAASLGWPEGIVRAVFLGFSVAARLSLAVVGLIIFSRRADNWVALAVSGGLVSVLLEGVQGIDAAFFPVLGLLFGIGTALFLPIPFVFPSGRFEPPALRWPVIGLVSVYVITVVFLQGHPLAAGLTLVLTLIWVVLSGYAMVHRYFRVAGPIERQQIKWVLLGLSATFVSATTYTTANSLFPVSEPSEMRLAAMLLIAPVYLLAYAFFAFSMLVAILRHRLWDIGLIVRRTLQYTVLTGLLALTYAGGIIVLQGILAPLSGASGSPLATVVTTLGIAALFTPLRRRTQELIDRRFYRRKYDAERALAAFASRARDEVDLDRLSSALLEAVAETVQPDGSSLWLKPTEAGR